MAKPSFSVVIVIAILVTASLCYDLVGSWQLEPNSQPSQTINSPLTFQFDRTIDSSGRISSKLFVYDCFISQFLYQLKDNRISLNFQTSTLLADNCSLSTINQLRSMMLKVFSFHIKYDSLSLVGLNGDAVFVLTRQKIDFAKAMVGAWTLSSPQQNAKHPARINGSCINLCQDQGQLKYSVQTINGSYPRLKTQVLVNSSCTDVSFLNNISKAVFFQVAANRSQLTFFDSNLKPSFLLNKIGQINANQQLYTAAAAQNNVASVPANPRQTIQSTQTSVINTVNTATNTVSNINNANTANSVSVAPAPPANPPAATPTLQAIAQSQPAAIVMAPSRYQTSTSPSQSQTTQSLSTQPSAASTAAVSQFSFDFSSGQYSGYFSSSPLFSPVTAPTAQLQSAPSVPDSPSANQDQPVITLSDDSFFSAFGSSSQQVSSAAQGVPASTSSYISSPTAPIAATVPNITSQGISSGSAISVPINQFVLSNKWLLTWLNGISALPSDFNHVYLIFTSSRIILYCPCNTFYTAYQLQDNNLTGIKWQGTKNQCQTNRDSLITNFIFYSTAVRQNGQNILFYYGSRAKMAEFKPYY